MSIAILAFFAVSPVYSENLEKSALFTKHFNETLFAISEKGQVSIEILLDEKEYKIGKDVIGIVVHDSNDKDIEDAKLSVMVTGMAEPLKVKEKADGLYIAPSMGLPKEGTWRLSISVKKKKIEDEAIFSFPDMLNKKMPAGKYDADSIKGKK